MNTIKLHKAITFALEAHNGQFRKGKDVPYIVHPVAVSILVAQAGGTENSIIAALLHDTVEDTPVTLGQIKYNFGEDVAKIVKDLTEVDKTLSWSNRKQLALEHIPKMSQGSLLVKTADLLHNISDTVEDYKLKGKDMLKAFNASGVKQLSRYAKAAEAIDKANSDNPLLPLLTMQIFELNKLLN